MQGFAVIRAGLKTNSRVVGELRHNNVHVTSLWCTKIFVTSVAYQLWREIGWGDLAVVLWYIVVVPSITTISGKLMYGFQVRSNPCTKMKIQMHPSYFNTLRPRQNGRHFADDIFKCIFLKENVWIPIKISLKFDPKGPINNIPALVQIMAWRRPGDKPLYEPTMVSLLTHICYTRPQWVNRRLYS